MTQGGQSAHLGLWEKSFLSPETDPTWSSALSPGASEVWGMLVAGQEPSGTHRVKEEMGLSGPESALGDGGVCALDTLMKCV